MDHFTYKHSQLHAEEVAIADIAAAVGTPFYVYSHSTLTHHFRVFHDALKSLNPLVCFAVKANSNVAVLATLAKAGSGADVVSEGELRRALAAGISPDKIVFSGVGKTREEMRYALSQKIFQFNVESERELLALNEVALSMGVKAPIALRVNPDVDAATHAKISTGKKENKFGIDIDIAPKIYAHAATLAGINVQGVSIHIGSQLTSLDPFKAAYLRVRELVELLRTSGVAIRTIDLGGGLGVPYTQADAAPPPPADYAKIVREAVGDLGAQLIFEPGRLIAGNAGLLVTKVVYVKHAAHTYVIIDAGMNDLLRPALYDAVHEIVPVSETTVKPSTVSVVGPVCESSDVFVKDYAMPLPAEGDLLALRTAGAYGATMSNSYNSRLLIPEVMVKGSEFSVIRPRPSYEEMLAQESVPKWI
ncbi:MAG: diaminopimelate decarboxylase [Alphaproteobacteria bacterium]|nr:diaminopimelate decarboxylase [Alphaproteobacteria bacterium]